MSQSSKAQSGPTLRDGLRQMLALLQAERQALAAMDLEAILGTAMDKRDLCGWLDGSEAGGIDAECRGLLDAAQRQNAVNRQVRNLIAANVSARLDALTGGAGTYRAPAAPGHAPAYAYSCAR